FLERKSAIVTKVKDESLDKEKVFEMYYDYQEPVSEIKNHRILAIDRGESIKILKVNIVEDTERVYKFFYKKVIGMDNESSITAEYVKSAIEDAYSRLIKPSVEREVRATLKEKAEDSAIFVFGENLRKYLLTPPMKGKVVLGLDPAFRTGCKLAVIDNTGKFIFKDKIDPHQHYPGEHVPESREELAAKKFKETILKYKCEVVAMGNGTASRESEAFVVKCLKEMQGDLKKAKLEVQYIIVNEAGASVYSASKIAQEEFPDFSVEERSAVSIARRLQDPLSELVKIDPKSIGVGQYQHDVNQKKLGETLDFVVEEAVNNVGVNVNLASVYLLKRVSGLNLTNAKTIVAYRDKNGKYTNRKDLKIKGITAKTLEQAIGFLRIPDGNEKLDMTSIHPESYVAAEAILKKLGLKKSDIGSTELKEAIENADKKELAQGLEIGEYTFADIIDSLTSPLRDPRDAFDAPLLKSDVTTLDDLYSGMELQGTVRNVVDFGVFVDCGVHEDGLVHISKIKEGYIKHPLDVVSVGDIVKVWVVSVNKSNNRLELTMIDPDKKK
ncbi:MAG: helix-hairpin-helix domain-containing protein, partial [Bacilli bacterium]